MPGPNSHPIFPLPSPNQRYTASMEFTRPPLLPTGHSLSNPRLSPTIERPSKSKRHNEDNSSSTFAPLLDTSTLAAHDFDVDVRSGFMPPAPPVDRLPTEWQDWELVLDKAREARLKVGDGPGVTAEDVRRSQEWREIVLNVGIGFSSRSLFPNCLSV